MPNNFSSNEVTKLERNVLKGFENSISLLKNVTTPEKAPGDMRESGDTTYVERPQRAKSTETADGDLTSVTPDDIIDGRASVTAQNYITVYKAMRNVDAALRAGPSRFENLMEEIGKELATKAELNLGAYLNTNAGLCYGVPGQPLNTWGEVAGTGALLESLGASVQDSCYFMNPFGRTNLANVQSSLSAGDKIVESAFKRNEITNPIAGVKCVTSTSLKQYQSGATADRTGTLAATPNATYTQHKDSMRQVISIAGLSPSVTDALRPGDVIRYDNRYMVNLKTREVIYGADGLPVKFCQTVVDGGDTDGSGTVTATVTSPGIFESDPGAGAYNNISSALSSGDELTVLGAANAFVQPNIFYEKEAVMYATVDLPELKGHVTSMMSNSGFVIRVTQADDAIRNMHVLRADILPALGMMEPQKCGKAFGVA